MTAKEFVSSTINNMVSLGGDIVTPQEYLRRLNICNGCDRQGEVEPVPFVKMFGCTVCKCPSATKPRFKTYFSLKQFKIILATCPHPIEGDKWKV